MEAPGGRWGPEPRSEPTTTSRRGEALLRAVIDCFALTSLSLPALESVGDTVTIYGNFDLVSIDVSALDVVDGDIVFTDNFDLCGDVPADIVAQLSTFGGTLTASANNGSCPP